MRPICRWPMTRPHEACEARLTTTIAVAACHPRAHSTARPAEVHALQGPFLPALGWAGCRQADVAAICEVRGPAGDLQFLQEELWHTQR